MGLTVPGPGARRRGPAAPSSGSTSRAARSRRSTPIDRADGSSVPLRAPERHRLRRPRRLLVQRPRRPPRAARRTARGLHYASTRRLVLPRGRVPRSTRPTASASRPTATPSTPPRPTPAGCGSGTVAGPARSTRPRSTRSGPAARTCSSACPGMQLLDSLAVDGEGWVCVATLINGGITAISPDGATVEHVPFADPLVTNICFGGDDLRTAYVTLSGTGQLVKTTWPRPGLRLAHTRLNGRRLGSRPGTPVPSPAMAQRFWVETLGCPKNSVDSDKLTGRLLADGYLACRRARRRRPRRRQHLRLHRGGPPGVDRHDPRPQRRPPRRRRGRGDRLHGRALRRRAGRALPEVDRGRRLRRPGHRRPSTGWVPVSIGLGRRVDRRAGARPAQPAPARRRPRRGPT